jgi:hypothetical protein
VRASSRSPNERTPATSAAGLSKLNSETSSCAVGNDAVEVDVDLGEPGVLDEGATVNDSPLNHQQAQRPPVVIATGIPRKEVIQPQLPLRLPCYDFTPIIDPTFDGCLPCGLAHRLRVLPTFVV